MVAIGVGACGGRTELPVPLPPCPARSADCDGDPENGCEVDLATDVTSCGACGAACPDGLSCADGKCVPGETIVQIESMDATTFVRSADGRVLVWGSNQYGKGNPRSDAELISTPEQLELPEPVVEVRPSSLVTCARGVSGRVWCWGDWEEIPGVPPHDTSHDFVAVPGVADARALMVSEVGRCVFDAHARGLCWSFNGDHELSTGSGHPVPLRPPSAVEMSAVEGQPLVTLFPSLAAVEHGPILTWGSVNTLGRLPPYLASNVRTPIEVPGLVDPVRVEGGYGSYCASLRDGRVLCWGPFIQISSPTYVPLLVFEHGPYKKVGACESRCALDSAGHVECKGEYDYDVDEDGVADLACGIHHLCLLMQDQRVLCKGDNDEGEQGNGTAEGHADHLTEVHLPALH